MIPSARKPFRISCILCARLAVAATVACTPARLSLSSSAPAPDRILYNARIWTGDSAHPTASAIAIRNDTIIAVGADTLVRALAGSRTRAEDLGGRPVIPGLHDAHWHLPVRRQADISGARNVEEIVERLRAFAVDLPARAWLLGRGWMPEMFARGEAHRRLLDASFPDRAVLLTDRDGHQLLANSHALALAGVTSTTPDPDGGSIVRDADGMPTGLLQETAMDLVRRMLPAPTEAEVYASLRHEMRRASAFGLTSLQVANALGPAESAAFARALAEDSLLVRFRIAVPFVATASDSALRAWVALRDRHTGPMLRYGIAKGMVDGTIDAGTAAMLAPFAVGGGTGLPRWSDAALRTALARYDSAGIQVQLHAIGDRAIRMALDAFEWLARVNGPRDRRGRIEHIEVPDPSDIPRFAALGVIASNQAIFATPETSSTGHYSSMLGPMRAARAMPFKAFDDAGAMQAFGSDYPVFTMDPLLGIYTAVTRQLPNGQPPGGSHPQHRISVEMALRHYTAGSAYAAYREDEIGVLRPGMLADLVVLSEPILGVGAEALLRAKPVLTMVGGRDIYRDTARRTP